MGEEEEGNERRKGRRGEKGQEKRGKELHLISIVRLGLGRERGHSGMIPSLCVYS